MPILLCIARDLCKAKHPGMFLCTLNLSLFSIKGQRLALRLCLFSIKGQTEEWSFEVQHCVVFFSYSVAQKLLLKLIMPVLTSLPSTNYSPSSIVLLSSWKQRELREGIKLLVLAVCKKHCDNPFPSHSSISVKSSRELGGGEELIVSSRRRWGKEKKRFRNGNYETENETEDSKNGGMELGATSVFQCPFPSLF